MQTDERASAAFPLLLLVVLASLPLAWLFLRESRSPWATGLVLLSLFVAAAALLALASGHRRSAAWLFILNYFLGAGLGVLYWEGVTRPGVLWLTPLLPLTALLLGRRGLIVVVPAVLSLIAAGISLEQMGLLPEPVVPRLAGLEFATVVSSFVLLSISVIAFDRGWVRATRERSRVSERLAEASRVDAVSGLPNATVLRERLAAVEAT